MPTAPGRLQRRQRGRLAVSAFRCSAPALLLRQLGEKDPPRGPHHQGPNRSPERGVRARRGRLARWTAAPFGGIMRTSLGAPGCSATRSAGRKSRCAGWLPGAGSAGGGWVRGRRVAGGWQKGCPWVCSGQTRLKQKTDPGPPRALPSGFYRLHICACQLFPQNSPGFPTACVTDSSLAFKTLPDLPPLCL